MSDLEKVPEQKGINIATRYEIRVCSGLGYERLSRRERR